MTAEAVVSIALLAIGAGLMLWRPRGVPAWIGPVVAATVAVASTSISFDTAGDALRTMRDPLLFLVFAVPLAAALDRVGVFEAVASLLDGGRHLVAWLWVLAAGVTIVFNLDAAVVLLTPLYLRIARRQSLPAEALVFQPALLACLASQPLPVSNLTNLLVAERFDLTATDFVRHLGLPTLAAVTAGWWAYRRTFPSVVAAMAVGQPDAIGGEGVGSLDLAADRRALRSGLPIVGFVLVGFTLGDTAGVPAWVVAAVALVAALAVVAADGTASGSGIWRAVPWEAVAIAAGLSVLVAGAVPHLGLARLLSADGAVGRLQALVVGGLGADLTNNLPAVLATMPALGDRDQVWPLLVGVNMAPAFVLTGALSSLLWRDTAARLGVQVGAMRFAQVGVRVGLPAFAAAGVLVVLAP